MDFVFGYVAGLLTLINPCVLPVLPIVLASALQGDRQGNRFWILIAPKREHSGNEPCVLVELVD